MCVLTCCEWSKTLRPLYKNLVWGFWSHLDHTSKVGWRAPILFAIQNSYLLTHLVFFYMVSEWGSMFVLYKLSRFLWNCLRDCIFQSIVGRTIFVKKIEEKSNESCSIDLPNLREISVMLLSQSGSKNYRKLQSGSSSGTPENLRDSGSAETPKLDTPGKIFFLYEFVCF